VVDGTIRWYSVLANGGETRREVERIYILIKSEFEFWLKGDEPCHVNLHLSTMVSQRDPNNHTPSPRMIRRETHSFTPGGYSRHLKSFGLAHTESGYIRVIAHA
jgi:hypothetical protein